jgi:hypothetical protein
MVSTQLTTTLSQTNESNLSGKLHPQELILILLISRMTMTILWKYNKLVTNFHVPASIVHDENQNKTSTSTPQRYDNPKDGIFVATQH